MRAVVQRVKRATVESAGHKVSEIKEGLLAYIGFERQDTECDIEYMAEKILNLRIFEDERGFMNLSLQELKKQLLVVSQFTLLADARKGRRPSFHMAMEPESASAMFEKFFALLKKKAKAAGLEVKRSLFKEHMLIESINDGPVTILIDSRKKF